MWALLNDAEDTIDELIQHPKTMVISGITYPRQMFQWSTSELKAVGIVPVTTSGTSLNSAYYIEKNEAFAIAGDKNSVVKTIGEKAADRKLADEDAKDEDGNQLLNQDGSKTINYGLKTIAKNKATTQANGYLQGFSWLIERKVTADKSVPSDVVTYMAAIRKDCDDIQSALAGASDLDAFIALHNDTYKIVDDEQVVDVVARVNRWTDDSGVKAYRR
tara:strand:+ start:782 stop:1435 length:654 start_codon:yes stop_codon:yes gene_type:complete